MGNGRGRLYVGSRTLSARSDNRDGTGAAVRCARVAGPVRGRRKGRCTERWCELNYAQACPNLFKNFCYARPRAETPTRSDGSTFTVSGSAAKHGHHYPLLVVCMFPASKGRRRPPVQLERSLWVAAGGARPRRRARASRNCCPIVWSMTIGTRRTARNSPRLTVLKMMASTWLGARACHFSPKTCKRRVGFPPASTNKPPVWAHFNTPDMLYTGPDVCDNSRLASSALRKPTVQNVTSGMSSGSGRGSLLSGSAPGMVEMALSASLRTSTSNTGPSDCICRSVSGSICATSGNFARCDATSASQAASLSASVGISRRLHALVRQVEV